MSKFWIVWNQATNAPITGTNHSDKQSAVDEAIAHAQSTASTYFVMEAVGDAAPTVSVAYADIL